jgi:transcription-repair coupling factor (superfamily II helicase)
LDEVVALSESLATTWGPQASDATTAMPRLHLGFDRLLAHTTAKVASLLAVAESSRTVTLQASGWPPMLGDSAGLARRLSELVRAGNRIVICADGRGSAERMATVLEGEGLSCGLLLDQPPAVRDAGIRRPGVHIVVAPLDRGGLIPSSKLAIVAEPDVTGRRRPHRQARPRPRATEGFFDDLAPGDYVVHNVHGVARFAGMVTRAMGGAERDYLQLEYRGGDRLYLPSEQIDAITPYTGGESPALNRMGGAEWSRQKARVRAAVREVAKELVELYRRRQSVPGHAFAPDTPWQTELEQAFLYPETPDQLKAIDDVKADMERALPMDRLVCGDVGFGKTEVAVRAVFKAVQDGYQAAILVPTTLLAQQHFQTFSDRYAPYPVRVEVLSRFLTVSEARKVVEGLADGSVDVVIGTHRLLTPDVRFKRLGLLVVDEEQRFGVSHKEAIKQLTIGVDVLTLTASPIPRTLEMSLTGIRDLSLITTPPSERQPILTYVGEQDERAVAEALRRELLREGQIFYVHNRVHDIERVAADLRALVPDARIAVAHGQMDEGTLEQVVLDFWAGGYDVLVCTTIIESGIDMPSVNTLVVDRADRLGLGQLHQLRGRVGRAGRRAYAYLLFPPDHVLSEQAYERLRTIGEHTELGSGFKIAMRDLEIRGAGNLLGRDQSGHIAAVGYDLYVRLVAEAVSELKGEPVRVPVDITVDLPVDAFLPPEYVEREDLRLEAYRRLAEVRDPAAVEDLRTEWLDRYGPLPREAEALVAVGRLRAECVRTGVTEVTASVARPGGGGPGRTGEAVARLAPIRLRASARVRLVRLHPRAIVKQEVDQIIVPLVAGPDLADRLAVLLSELVPAERGDGARGDPDATAVDAAKALAAGNGARHAPTI